MKRYAFTMMELVFVIVGIGIMSAVILPRTDRDSSREAALHFAQHIRFAQHLAMVEDPFRNDEQTYFFRRWSLAFLSGNRYVIAQSSDGTNVFANYNFAQDPLTSSQLDGTVGGETDLADKFNVSSVVFTGGCANDVVLTFDHIGRPLTDTLASYAATTNRYTSLLKADCIITITANGESSSITMSPETAYVRIN